MFSIRYKILIIVIPLLMGSMVILTIISIGFSRNGINKIAKEFLGYKINEIIQKCNNDIQDVKELGHYDEEMIRALKIGIEEYSSSIIKKDIESVVAIDSKGIVKMSTDPFLQVDDEVDFFHKMQYSDRDWITFEVKNFKKVGFYRYFEEWDWYFLLSAYTHLFYKDANLITIYSIIILIASIFIMIILLFLFINYILLPLKNVVSTMTDIIKLNDLSSRVPVKFNDEIGELAFTFNTMLKELELAYNQIKEYAFQAVLSQKKEERIKNMFQKYVPQDVVNEIVQNPDQALIGKNAKVAVLFSDIRSFTTISESLSPEVIVDSLNRYFTIMVDIIYNRRGVIDKYIGDAIMAIFGAPKEYGDDVQQAIYAGLEMLEHLKLFNEEQKAKNRPEFKIGVGINYGEVTVGNIGTAQKMDYTVIGDSVNLASRLEGLTKTYNISIVVSEGALEAAKNYFYFREVDRVKVKGKLKPVKIYEPARKLSSDEKKSWGLYNKGVNLFIGRRWEESEKHFLKALDLLGGNDYLTMKYLEDIRYYRINPPEKDWDGTTTMKYK